jgi:hypothetical protein
LRASSTPVAGLQASDDRSADLAPVDLVLQAQEAVVLVKVLLAQAAPALAVLAPVVPAQVALDRLEDPGDSTTDHPAEVPALAPMDPRGHARHGNPEAVEPVYRQAMEAVSSGEQRSQLQSIDSQSVDHSLATAPEDRLPSGSRLLVT